MAFLLLLTVELHEVQSLADAEDRQQGGIHIVDGSPAAVADVILVALGHVGGESCGVHRLQLQFHAGLGKVRGQNGHDAVHIGHRALVGNGEAQRLAIGAFTDAVAVGIHITGVLQNGGGSSGIKLRLTDVGSGKVTVNGADRRVHRRCSAGHGHVYQSLTVAAGGQGLTNIHILQQFVGLREGDERIGSQQIRSDSWSCSAAEKWKMR